MIHHLKIYPEHFSAVCTGVKRAELRKNDRDFKVGDTLHLMETPKGSCNPTGEFINAVVTHIADVGEWLPGYVMLSIEREPGYAAPQLPQPAVVDERIRREINVGGYLWAQCSSSAFDRAKAEGKIVRELYERPQPAVKTAHSSVIAEQLAHILSGMDVTDHQRAVINCAVDRLNKNAEMLQQSSTTSSSREAILYEPSPTDSVNAPLEFTDVEDRAWVVGAEWMRDAFKGENPHLRIANDDDPAPITASGSKYWQNWIADVAEYLEGGIEADGELEAEGSIEAKRLLARRAAMLRGAEPVSQPYTLGDGWVAVPVELTGDMTNAMTDAILDDLHNVDVWRSVLAAAPQQEVKP